VSALKRPRFAEIAQKGAAVASGDAAVLRQSTRFDLLGFGLIAIYSDPALGCNSFQDPDEEGVAGDSAG